jgi:phage terminase Nu1 subunit (DNA packaging protein)
MKPIKMAKTVWSQSQIAEIFSVSISTVRNWHNIWLHKCLMPGDQLLYDAKMAIAEWVRVVVAPPKDEAADGHESLDKAKLRYERAKADQAELKAKREAGLLVSRESSVHWAISLMTELKTSLMALPRRSASMLEGKSARDIERELDGEIRSILTRVGKPIERQAGRAEKAEKLYAKVAKPKKVDKSPKRYRKGPSDAA